MYRKPSSSRPLHLLLALLLASSSLGCRAAAWWSPWSGEAAVTDQDLIAPPTPDPVAATAIQPVASKSEAIVDAADLLGTIGTEGEPIDGWYRVDAHLQTDGRSSFRWQHQALDQLLEQSQVDLTAALENDDLAIRATAAIGLARRYGGEHARALPQIVSATRLSPALRCAAAETYLHTAAAEEAAVQLQTWLTTYADQVPLHAELLLAAADRFAGPLAAHWPTALSSRAPEVRRAALLALRDGSGPLPTEAIELMNDADLSVRITAIELFGTRPIPAATERLCGAARDADLSVRLAAVASLAQHSDITARETLLQVLARDGERVRAAAVVALARRGEWPTVRSAATDKSWLVRSEVAAAFDHWQIEQDLIAAYALLEDRSMEVRLRLIESLRRWPLEHAGPLLIVAASQRTFAPSQAALEQLQTRWPPAVSIAAPAGDATSPAWQQLTEAFADQFGSDGRRLPAPVIPAAVPAVTDTRNYADRIPAEFGVIARLSDADLHGRRQAALELEQMAADHPLSSAALSRLASVAPADNDPLVWRSLLNVIGRNGGSDAFRLAYAALSHPDGETRRRACLYLAEHPDRQHVAPLAVSLEEQEPRICVAAIKAYAANASTEQLQPLVALTHSASSEIRLAAAVELARCGHSAGHNALERLAGDPRAGVRRAAVEAMGDLQDPLYLPLLMILLDDRYDVRLAALEALPKVTAHDPTEGQLATGGNVNQRCTAWQRWYARGGNFAAAVGRN